MNMEIIKYSRLYESCIHRWEVSANQKTTAQKLKIYSVLNMSI